MKMFLNKLPCVALVFVCAANEGNAVATVKEEQSLDTVRVVNYNLPQTRAAESAVFIDKEDSFFKSDYVLETDSVKAPQIGDYVVLKKELASDVVVLVKNLGQQKQK